jgi:hypothetical protein
VQPPTADHRPTVTYHRPTGEAVPAPMGRSYRVDMTDTDPDRQMGRGLEETCSARSRRRASTGIGGYDPGYTALWGGGLWFEDTVTEWSNISSQGGSGYSP